MRKRTGWDFDPALISNNKWALTFSPLAMIHLDFTFMPGVEYGINRRLRLAADAGYIFASVIDEGAENAAATGFLVRPGLKWFTSEKSTFYLHAQGFFKQVNRPGTRWVDQGTVNGVPAFQQLLTVTDRREVHGFNLIAGFLEPISRNNRNVFVDVYAGFGVRWKKRYTVNQPDDITWQRGDPFIWNDGGALPSLPVGVRFLYRF